MLVLGNQNAGKSTGAKAYIYRQVGTFGRRALITDVKREYVALAGRSAARSSRSDPLTRRRVCGSTRCRLGHPARTAC